MSGKKDEEGNPTPTPPPPRSCTFGARISGSRAHIGNPNCKIAEQGDVVPGRPDGSGRPEEESAQLTASILRRLTRSNRSTSTFFTWLE